MDSKASETTDSVNVRIAKLLGYSEIEEREWWYEDFNSDGHVVGMVGIAPGGSEQVPLPDFEESVDAVLAALDPARRNLQVVLRYNVYEKRSECMLLKTGGGQRAHVCTRYGEKDDDYALAAAHALEALLLATAKEDAG
ncbi:MAG: hypothetical protein U0521_26290 [Anaerolineae bacterium]